MVTCLRVEDFPKSWFSSKNEHHTTSVEKSNPTEGTAVQDFAAEEVVHEPNKRGRGRPKRKAKVVDVTKGKTKRKSMTASAADVVLGRSKTNVPDVNDLRRKREADALACGRNVRTILEAQKLRSSEKTKTANSADGDTKRNAESDEVASSVRSAPPKSLQKGEEIDEVNKGKVRDAVHLEQMDNIGQPSFGRCVGKEPMADDGNQSKRFERSLGHKVLSDWKEKNVEKNVDSENGGWSVGDQTPKESPLPPTAFYYDRNGERVAYEEEFYEDAHGAQRRELDPYSSESRPNKFPRHTVVEEHWSPPRRLSRSPGQRRDVESFTEMYEGNAYAAGYDNESRHLTRFSNAERSHRRYGSSSAYKGKQQMSPYSPENGRGHRRRSMTPVNCQSPPRTSMNGRNIGVVQRSSSHFDNEANMENVPAIGRRERRQRQSFREAERTTRQRDGKKPFYLTLDAEGKPHGPGRPAWIAELNKLATGLDPSCTNVRKQTFEDVQTLKERLNENFDYSGLLNEDYVRGQMGKAVTKRRAELISVIKRGGKRLVNLDRKIWKRLKKLARSKQWEQKSEQGRHANASRKTLGRTGSRGVNGVREKLRLLLGRSPDPDEVEEEMQRDKGYGGKKRKMSTAFVKREESSGQLLSSSEDSLSEAFGRNSDGSSSDTADSEHIRQHGRNDLQVAVKPLPIPSYLRIEAEGRDYGVVDMDVDTRRASSAQLRYTLTETENISKDMYIQKLEAELQRFHAENAKGTVTSISRLSQSTMSMSSKSKK